MTQTKIKVALQRLIEQAVKDNMSRNLFFLKEQIKQPLAMDLPVDLYRLAKIFKDAGHKLFLVGGAVRDALLGKEPKDYDVATDATPDRILAIMARYPDHKKLTVGKQFGVIEVITPEKNSYEIATFRIDIGAGRRPDAVEYTTIEQDVLRRDLTINALFYDIDRGEVVDYVGGIEDLKNKVVRAVGDPRERFDEDRLRILRAFRFASRMGSKLDPEAEAAILDDNSLEGVSPERIRDEFLKSIRSARSATDLYWMYEHFSLWPQVFPGLSVNKQFEETSNIPVALALLLRDNGTEAIKKKLNALKYNANETKQVMFLNMLQDLSVETAFVLKKLWKSAKLSEGDLEEFARLNNERPSMKLVKAFNVYQPSVGGKELLAQGFKGKALGQEQDKRETELFGELL